MRKLTGYIGAMIIVFALMGSILAGFALNINGQSTVINSYETVTDVSGLYNHTQEKAYIDYNPASNYIGYQSNKIFDNPVGASTFKKIDNGSIKFRWSDKHIIVNNVDQGAFYSFVNFICSLFYISYENGLLYVYSEDSGVLITINGNDIDMTIGGGNIVLTSGGNTYNWTNVKISLIHNTTDPDYYSSGNTPGTVTAYLKNKSDVIYLTQSPLGIYNYDKWVNITGSSSTTADLIGTGTTITGDVKQYNLTNTTIGYNLYVYYPISVKSPVLGIDYTESNRVNNYPISTTPSNTTITTSTIDLMNITATSYWPTNTGAPSIYSQTVQGGPYGPDYILSPGAPNAGVHNYKLSDVLANYSIPANTKTIQINGNGTTYTTANMYYANYSVNMDNNLVGFTNLSDYVDNTRVNYSNIFGQKDYLIYDLDRGIVDVYDYNGVKKYSNAPDKIMVCFTDTGYNSAYVIYYVDLGGNITSVNPSLDFPNDRARPYINLIATSITAESIDYMDITKGIKINPSNAVNVTWDNQYENGLIELLFRAMDTNQTYTNTINVSGNDITIDYIDGRFYVTLNSNDPVDIGTWRNIVLDIDLNSGKLNVTPVRTFNSFTNVIVDKANIQIGDLLTPTPTNIITWEPTAKSLTFNVYSTKVFMDTYGIVMVNPSLNIIDYFTDLNNFYELRLYNFSIFGDSITVNGVTGTVSGNSLTIGSDIVTVKDMAVKYADGHAYIEDSNVSIDLGAITNNTISMAGTWYFETELLRGVTDTKLVYDWDWSQFILDNTQFCVFYMGLAIVGLIIARHFCTLSIIDYAALVVSFIIALGVQVIA